MVVEACGSSLLISSGFFFFSVNREEKSWDETEDGGEDGWGFRKRYEITILESERVNRAGAAWPTCLRTVMKHCAYLSPVRFSCKGAGTEEMQPLNWGTYNCVKLLLWQKKRRTKELRIHASICILWWSVNSQLVLEVKVHGREWKLPFCFVFLGVYICLETFEAHLNRLYFLSLSRSLSFPHPASPGMRYSSLWSFISLPLS